MRFLSSRPAMKCSLMIVAVAALSCGTASAEPYNRHTDWLRDAGHGIFVHYLGTGQNNPGKPQSLGKRTSWDECVAEFDTETFAEHVAQSGAGYVIFTAQQHTRFLPAPNETYNRLTGFAPGEACATRDLIEDLYQSLSKRDIALMLYWTGDGPCRDKQAAAAMGGWDGKATDEYVRNWASVAADYAKRYGEKVRGWWVDGCYERFDYNQERWGMLARAMKSGSPKTIVALNNPMGPRHMSKTDWDDFTTGEFNQFKHVPDGRWQNGKQFHMLSYLGPYWAHGGCRIELDELAEYIARVNRVGGAVSIEVVVNRDGSIESEQLALLRKLPAAIEQQRQEIGPVEMVPPGNVAYGRPARLLSLDGTRPLQVNGGGGRPRHASFGVDGDPATWAQPGGEHAWTYQVELADAYTLRRVVITFGETYATHFDVRLSPNGKDWTTVATRRNHDGEKVTLSFEPTDAVFLQLRAIKPDGPDQPGGQMQVAELEAYAE